MDFNGSKMRDLIYKLNYYSQAYYNGQAIISDAEWDKMYQELQKLEELSGIVYTNSPTINVGSKVLNELKECSIQGKPMLSLKKVYSAKDIVDFSDGYDLIASIKCDGLSIRLIYEDGKLIFANTRGDGYSGGEVTEHVKQFLNVPLQINKKGRYVVDGEAIIFNKDFKEINKNNQFANNRNTASGALSLLDTSIVKSRRLSFILWDVIEGGNSNYYHYNLEEADDLGFEVVPARAIDCTKVEEEEIDATIERLTELAKEKGYPCDGIVWRINDIKAGEQKGYTEHHFNNAIAWKPANIEYPTKLLDIEWGMGRTGVLTPVAIFEPVDTGDSVIERASLHNLSVMRDVLGRYPEYQQKIYVAKMNMITPHITRVEYKNNSFHDHILTNGFCTYCPCCGEPTEIVQSDNGIYNIVCGNPSCEGKLENRIDHYLGKNGLNVKGISKMTIRKLLEWSWINELRDIYKLNEHKAEWESKPGFGAASVGKILAAIDAEGRHTKLESYISAIGIPLVGKAVAKEICKYYSTWKEFRDAVGGDWTVFEGFGPNMSASINNFNYKEFDEIAQWITFSDLNSQNNNSIGVAIKDKKFCVTGKLTHFKNRDELQADIESFGGKLVSSVSSVTDYLITNTPNSGTGKNTTAQALGVKIITENEYMQMRE